MPTLVIDNIPASIYERIQQLAKTKQRTPSDAALEVLENAFRAPTPGEPPLPQEPFLTEEICAPCDIPWPEGKRVVPVKIANYLPEPHDIPETE